MNSPLMVCTLAAVYGVIYAGLAYIPLPPFIKSYIAPPVMWALVTWTVLKSGGYRTSGKIGERSMVIAVAALTGFIQVVVYVIGGLFSKFGKNPSALTPLGIITNLFFVGLMLVGMELARAWLINRAGKRHSGLVVGLVSIYFTLLAIPLSQFTSFSWEASTITRVNSAWLPMLAESLMASLLVRVAGARASLTYRGILAAFWWFCPIIPDLPWALKGLIGTAVPIVGMMAVNSFQTESSHGKPARRSGKGAFPAGWVVTSITSVIIVWFAAGLFPFHPSSVGSGSMIPVLNVGDVVIVGKVQPNMIKIGDVIEYKRKESNDQVISVLHRVIEINGTGDNKTFITKGDANNAADPAPVPPANVVGKIVLTIPKVGWLSLEVKKLMAG